MPEPMQVGLVALAAGSSRRFGSANKLLHEVDGEPLVRRVVSRLCDGATAAGVDVELVVVLGCDEASVRGALSGFAAQIGLGGGYDYDPFRLLIGMNPHIARLGLFMTLMYEPIVPAAKKTE